MKLSSSIAGGVLGSLALLSLAPDAHAQSWSSPGGGASGWVYASTVWNGKLVVGGAFTFAGGTPANHVAMWNGSTWQALGAGFDGDVWALTVYNGKLIAGGTFIFSGGVEVKYIAEWTGSAWTDLEGGMDNRVVALTTYKGSLIAGGYFNDADGPANHVARWDGHSWFPLGSGTAGGTQGQVMALTVHGDDLIAGGFISSAGGIAANHVAKWNGSTWSPLAAGVNGIVYSLASNGSTLAAGCLNGIQGWNGAAWSPLGTGTVGGTYPYVLALAVYGGDFFAGGLFKSIGGVPAEGFARWNGTEWTADAGGVFNGGATSGLYTLTPYGTSLAAGGIFYSAGGVSSGDVAIWNQPYFDHGVGCSGIGGIPQLSGVGVPEANSVAGLQVTHGRPLGTGLLLLGTQANAAPFFGCSLLVGGTLVGPLSFGLNGAGAATLTTTFPASVPTGVGVRAQFFGLDANAANGQFSASNELLLVVQ
jgi:hypothetical protein